MNDIKMIYGTAWKKDQTEQLVQKAIECGFRAIDTACQPKHYNEYLVGQGIAKAMQKQNISREELFIQTKFTPLSGQDPNNVPYNPSDSLQKQICDSLEVSLKNLKTDYLDSLLLHSPIAPIENTIIAWRVFENFFEENLVKQIGISNCYDINLLQYIYAHATIKPTMIQNRFYAQTQYDKSIRKFCKLNNIMYQSFWSLTANPNIVNSQEIFLLAKKYKKTNEQIFYKFLSQIGITPLNGTTNPNHMIQDLEIQNFTLTSQEVEIINKRYIS
jgi:diketogulonate reductase-like aldo/keto reductase